MTVKTMAIKILVQGYRDAWPEEFKREQLVAEIQYESKGYHDRVLFDEKGIWINAGILRPLLHVGVRIGADGKAAWDVDVRAHFKKIVAAMAASDRGLIRVGLAGPGPTEKSCKVRFSWALQLPGRMEAEEMKLHTVTVPASMVAERDGKQWIPRWFAVRKSVETIEGQWRGRRSGPVDPGSVRVSGLHDEQALPVEVAERVAVIEARLEQLASQIEELAVRHAPAAVQQAAEAAERQKQWEAGREQRRSESAQREKAEQEQREQAKRELDEKEAARKAKMETVENARVVWSERVVSRTRNEQWLEEHEGCTVHFSGQRVYITKPDGGEVIKTRNTVQINGEALPEGHAVRKFLERQQQQ